MSIIVNGIGMPKDCDSCWLPERICNLWLATDLNKRYRGCPLRPLPEKHGRLIDADAMKELWTGAKIAGDIGCLLDARPTIVEAEGDI